jgi:hypothetical protein
VLDEIALTSIGAMLTNPDICLLIVGGDERIATLAAAATTDSRAGGYDVRMFPSMAAARAWLSGQPSPAGALRPRG